MEIERGQGLMTRILKTTPTKKLAKPIYRINMAVLKTRSDKEHAATLDRLADKQGATKQEQRELRGAIRALMNRGLLARVTEEQW